MTLTDLPIGGAIFCWYTPHAEVPPREAEGWVDEGVLPLPHGEYSNLMTRIEE